jgi:hypothetical protein
MNGDLVRYLMYDNGEIIRDLLVNWLKKIEWLISSYFIYNYKHILNKSNGTSSENIRQKW